jgi:hypothetical protein
MKRNTFLFLILLFLSGNLFGQDTIVYLYEDFEDGIKDTWKQIYKKGTIDWYTSPGGHTTDPSLPGSGSPPYAAQGQYNALFHYTNLNLETTRLITAPINLEFAIKPELQFMHAQEKREMFGETNNDLLTVFFMSEKDSNWVNLGQFGQSTTNWQTRSIQLPTNALSDRCYIGFQARTRNGWGVCVDSVKVFETGVKQRTLDSIIVKQPNTRYIPTGTQNNPLLRIDLRVTGNLGELYLNQLTVNTLETKATDIDPGGVKLYATVDTFFTINNPVGTPQNFAQQVTFSNINYKLNTGYNTIWVTYDVAETARQGDTLDAMIASNSISVGGDMYPSANESPDGFRVVYQTIFDDDFETDKSWDLKGEFQRAIPQGLGGEVGNPDPDYAFSGDYVLGTDLTGLGDTEGDYEDSLSSLEYQAITPTFNCFYYKEVALKFQRWLNIDISDSALIDISTDNGATWQNIWFNNGTRTDDEWKEHFFNLSRIASRKKEVKLRFALGPSDASWRFSGWNIDDFFVTGDYVATDIALTRLEHPTNGTRYSSAEEVKVMVKNAGADPITQDIPLYYQISDKNGVVTTSTQTITQDIASGDSIMFIFNQKIDLSTPGFYNISVINMLNEDEYVWNDSINKKIYVIPTYNMPYVQDFEEEENFWLVNGLLPSTINGHTSSWEWGKPNGFVIDHAASGAHSWVTDIDGRYPVNDSSFVEGPYFDFTGVSYPYVELKLWLYSEPARDGAQLQYTIDDGNTWKSVNKNANTWNWPWYTNNYIYALDGPGWDSDTTTGWISRYQFLPSEVIDKQVKFRMKFVSDSFYDPYEGIAFDDIIISDAPPDIAVKDIVSPTDACGFSQNEPITIALTNKSLITLKSGTKIEAGIVLNDTIVHVDTFLLSQNVSPNNDFNYTFTKKFDMYKTGDYKIKVFTSLDRDHNVYFGNNDTLTKTITASKPPLELGEDIYTFNPGEVTLDAYEVPGMDYEWQDGSTNTTFNVPEEGMYHVSVTDPNNGCTARDTIEIVELVADIGVTALLAPVSDCKLDNDMSVTIKIKNFGIDTFSASKPFTMGFNVDNGPFHLHTLSNKTLMPDSSLTHTFSKTVDMSDIRQYHLTSFVHYSEDNHPLNDTIKTIIEAYGPDFDLIPEDTTHIGKNYLLNAALGNKNLVSYEWQDSTTDSLFVVTEPGPSYYSVTVEENHGCVASDSSLVGLLIPDVELVKLISPQNQCGRIKDKQVQVQLSNQGTYSLPAGDTLTLTYQIDDEDKVSEAFVLDNPFQPQDIRTFTFTDSFDMYHYKNYNVKVYSSWKLDSDQSNDTINEIISVYTSPVVNLGPDTTVVDTPQYTLDAGSYQSYVWHDNSTTRKFLITAQDAHPDITASVTVTDVSGCKAVDEVYVTLDYDDLAVTNINQSSGICEITDNEPLQVELTNIGSTILTDNDVTLTFNYNDTSTREQFTLSALDIDGNIFYNESVIYTSSTVTISDKGAVGIEVISNMSTDIIAENDTLTDTVRITGNPVIDWGVSGDTIDSALPYTLGIDSSYSTYEWSTGSNSPTIEVTSQGSYSLTVTDHNGCTASGSIYVTDMSGISEFKNSGVSVLIYPNPASEHISVELTDEHEHQYKLEFYNANMQKMYTTITKKSTTMLKNIDISGWPAGVYYIKLMIDDEVIYRKIIVI